MSKQNAEKHETVKMLLRDAEAEKRIAFVQWCMEKALAKGGAPISNGKEIIGYLPVSERAYVAKMTGRYDHAYAAFRGMVDHEFGVDYFNSCRALYEWAGDILDEALAFLQETNLT